MNRTNNKLCGLTVFLLFFAGTIAYGQPVLEITSQGVLSYPEVVEYDDSISISFYVKNAGNAVFNDTIRTHQTINNNPPKIIDLTGAVTLNPGDSTLLTLSDYNFADPDFLLGQNGVVIWVTDDNLSMVNHTDSLNFFLTDGPAFKFGNFGMMNFPFQANTGTFYTFDLHIENNSEDDYFDTLYVYYLVNGDTMIKQSPGMVWIAGLNSIFLNQSNFEFTIPPFAAGNNEVKIWVRGTEVAMAIDTLYRTVEVNGMTHRESFAEKTLQLWPNPSQQFDEIRIQAHQIIDRVQVFNLEGSLLAEQAVREKQLNWTPDFSPGIFMLRVHLWDGQVIRKTLIVR